MYHSKYKRKCSSFPPSYLPSLTADSSSVLHRPFLDKERSWTRRGPVLMLLSHLSSNRQIYPLTRSSRRGLSMASPLVSPSHIGHFKPFSLAQQSNSCVSFPMVFIRRCSCSSIGILIPISWQSRCTALSTMDLQCPHHSRQRLLGLFVRA